MKILDVMVLRCYTSIRSNNTTNESEVIKMTTFSVITKSLQEAYEQGTQASQDKTPEICGYYGRACRQLEKQEGANRMLCNGCGLAYYSGGWRNNS